MRDVALRDTSRCGNTTSGYWVRGILKAVAAMFAGRYQTVDKGLVFGGSVAGQAVQEASGMPFGLLARVVAQTALAVVTSCRGPLELLETDLPRRGQWVGSDSTIVVL